MLNLSNSHFDYIFIFQISKIIPFSNSDCLKIAKNGAKIFVIDFGRPDRH